MCDSLQMYRTLMTAFATHIPRAVFGDIRRLMVLAWAVIGLCSTKTANFNQWGEVVISRAQYASSHQRRFQRWLHNNHVDPVAFYRFLFRAALATWDLGTRVYVALDTSVLPGGYVLIRTALIYRGRAIPIAWRVLKHASATVGYADYRVVLEQTQATLPAGLVVVLLADRGFLHHQLVQFAQGAGWHYRLRAKASTVVSLPDGTVTALAQLRPPVGAAHFYQGVHILGERIGPVHLALATPTPEAADQALDPWYVISDEPTGVTTLDEYGLRFDIEENFLDDKSNGFDVEASKLDEALVISRLFLVLAVATLYCTSVGVGVVNRQARRWVDTHWDRGMSYLKIGWSWLRQQFRRGWPVLPAFWLDPTPDPEPAVASRRQATQPKRQWVVSCFGVP